MPDMSLDFSDPSCLKKAQEMAKGFEGSGYKLHFSIGSFFQQNTTGKTDSQNLQSDGRSCSFISDQFGQKLDHMNSCFAFESLKACDAKDFSSQFGEVHSVKNRKAFSWIPFQSKFEDESDISNAQYMVEHTSAFFLPSEFYGTSQRLAPIILNEELFSRVNPGQRNSVYDRTADKMTSRSLWNSYFGFAFELEEKHSKYDKAILHLSSISGMESDYRSKLNVFKRSYNLNLISSDSIDEAIQIAKSVYDTFHKAPTESFFMKLGIEKNSTEYFQILERISPDLVPAKTQETGATPQSCDDDEDIPDMDDFDGEDNIAR